MRGAPLVRWSGGRLVDPAGREVTRAQEVKARAMLEGGLIHRLESTTDPDGSTVTAYRIDPVRGCKQARYLTHTRRREPASLRVLDSFRCDCQRARGTSAMAGGVCSHVLALSNHVGNRKP